MKKDKITYICRYKEPGIALSTFLYYMCAILSTRNDICIAKDNILIIYWISDFWTRLFQ